MTRRIGLLAPLLVAVLLGALVRLVGGGEDDADRFEYAARPAPRSSLSVGVADAVSPSGMQAALDRCNGPIAVTIRGVRPTLLAEHDFCGGRWIRRLDPGEVIRLAGGGVSGAYRVSDEIKIVDKGTSASAIRGMGDVVAQTCRPDGRSLRLVGLTKLS